MDASISVGLSLMLEEDFLGATLPLFEEGAVDVLEWSFDVGWGREVPAWAQGLLQHFSVSGKLLGHGVSYSPLSAEREEAKRGWLHRVGLEVARLRYRHVSEHYGFMAAGTFARGSPMPVPHDPAVVRTGRDSLLRLGEVTGLRVGLENLALALSDRDVDAQGDLLDALLEPVGGFVVLDLHNLWCQAINYRRDPIALLDRYPLERVAEVHVSGGSWSTPPSATSPFRRDTHDDRVPDEVIALLPEVIASCPRIEAVIVERLGGTFGGADESEGFRADFRRVREVVAGARESGESPPPPPGRASLLSSTASSATDVAALARFQASMLDVLHAGAPTDAVRATLEPLARSETTRGWIEAFDPRAIEVAGELVRKWGRREG